MSNTSKPIKKIKKPKDDTNNNNNNNNNNTTNNNTTNNKIISFFHRGDKIKTTEIVIAVLTGIYLTVIISLSIYFYISKSFIFEEYIRKEAPPYTISNPDSAHLLDV